MLEGEEDDDDNDDEIRRLRARTTSARGEARRLSNFLPKYVRILV
jgi:hypothetical protein